MKIDERQQAIDVLLKYGVLIKVDENLELLHGRADEKGKTWEIDPNFVSVNSVNSDFKLSTLSAVNAQDVTSSGKDGRALAEDFANAKASGSAYKKVYKLFSTGECYIWAVPDKPLTKAHQEEVNQAVAKITAPEQTNYAPIAFQEGALANKIMLMFVEEMKKAGVKPGPIPYSVVNAVINRFYDGDKLIMDDIAVLRLILDIDLVSAAQRHEGKDAQVKQLIRRLASIYNAEYLILHRAGDAVSWYVTGAWHPQGSELAVSDFGFPVCRDYIATWLISNNIIGYRTVTYNAKIGEKFTNYTIFDSNRVMTQEQYEKRQQEWQNQYGELSDFMTKTYIALKGYKPVVKLIKKGDRDEILEYFSTEWSEREMFLLKSGVWEGFTIKEHTKSVMRWYDTNYQDQLPPAIDMLMKICILVHDSGKGIANANGEKFLQKKYNAQAASKILKHIGLPESLQKIVQYIIGDGQSRTSMYYLHHQKSAFDQFSRDIAEVYMSAFGKQITKDQIEGLWKMCAILQNCDSGSYTLNGVTYDETTRKYYTNGNEAWTRSFDIPPSNDPAKGGFMPGIRNRKY